jgi:hypothetical protein
MAQPQRSDKLFQKAESALLAAIEIYNKPDFRYREETFSILMLNAWELLFKAKLMSDNTNSPRCLFIYESRTGRNGRPTRKKYLKKNRAGNVHTIGMGAAIGQLDKTAASRLSPAVKANIDALAEVRDNAVHYLNASFRLAQQVLEIGTASVKNFIELSKRWFQHDYSKYNLYLMPIGFISGPSIATAISLSANERKLVGYLATIMADPANAGTTSSGFNVALELNLSFKRAAADAVPVSLTRDPTAPQVILTEEDIRQRYPWDYTELTRRLNDRYADFLANAKYHELRKPLQLDERYVKARFLDPGNPRSAKKDFYSPNILSEFDKHYTLA